MAERRILWTTIDPRGLSISLAEDVWLEILDKHSEMAPLLDQVRATVENPEEIFFDPETTQQRGTDARMFLYYRGAVQVGGSRVKWVLAVVKVVIEVGTQLGYVETAHLISRKKKRAVLEWKS